MAKSLLIAGTGTQQTFIRAGIGEEARYFVCANAPLVLETVRARTQITYHSPGIISLGNVVVSENQFAWDAALVLEVNGVAGNTTITIPASLTGRFSDTTHTDAINDGDEVNWKLVSSPDDSGVRIGLTAASVVFAPTTDTVVRHAAINFAQQVNAQTTYAALSDDCSTLNTIEVYARFNCNAVGKKRKLFVYVSQWTNTSGFTATVTLRVNGSNTALTVSPTGTGIFEDEDVAHEVDIAANDDVNYVTVTTGTGSITVEIISVEWVSTAKQFHAIYARTGAGLTQNHGLTRFMPGGGGGALSAEPELSCRIPIGFAASISHLTNYISANTIDDPPNFGVSNFFVRKHGVDGNNMLNPSWGTTGQQEDSTHVDTFAAVDEIALMCLSGGYIGSITYRHIGMMVLNTDVVATVRSWGAVIG